MKKNCYNCKYLDYFDADYESSDQSGYICESRGHLEGRRESQLVKNLQRESYREKAKSCCELKKYEANHKLCRVCGSKPNVLKDEASYMLHCSNKKCVNHFLVMCKDSWEATHESSNVWEKLIKKADELCTKLEKENSNLRDELKRRCFLESNNAK